VDSSVYFPFRHALNAFDGGFDSLEQDWNASSRASPVKASFKIWPLEVRTELSRLPRDSDQQALDGLLVVRREVAGSME